MESRQTIWFFLFLIATVLTGLTFRWQLAGLQLFQNLGFDWRRAHSHLGFYGVLFPASWMIVKSLDEKTWVPSGRFLLSYFLIVILSAVGFLLQGYGLIAIVTSTLVLGLWLVYAWKNQNLRRLFTRDWAAPASISIYVSACLIPAVAITSKHDPALANQLARTFLTFLLMGVFVPACLRKVAVKPPHALSWLIATLVGATYLTQLIPYRIMGLGLIWLGLEIVRSRPMPRLAGSTKLDSWHLGTHWLLFALALIATGSGLLPYSFHMAIAGIHFLVLGPILMTFALRTLSVTPSTAFGAIYEVSLLTMVTTILVQDWYPDLYVELQRTAAISGSVIVVMLVVIGAQHLFHCTRRTSAQQKKIGT